MARSLGRIALIVCSILVVLAALEVTLRWRPVLLGHAFANGAATRYTTKPGGIYYHDRSVHMNFMLPNYTTTMYYNGYVWRHETDALGFRNKPLHIPADVMLLGDSVVYGHGVDFEHTLGRYLEERTGLRVANLGRQGDCAYQEAYLLGEYLPLFKPQVVVHVFTPNDIQDLYVYLSDAAMEAFIAQPFDQVTYPPMTDPAILVAERERQARKRTVWKCAKDELYVAKMLRWIRYNYKQWRGSAAIPVAEAAPLSPRHDPEARRLQAQRERVDTDPASLGWRYTAHALRHMKHRAATAGARFIMAPVARDRQLEILRDIAARHAIEIIDPTPLWNGPSFLPNDGHFTPHGARTMANLIAAALEHRPFEGRHGSAEVPRAVGGLGAISGPPSRSILAERERRQAQHVMAGERPE